MPSPRIPVKTYVSSQGAVPGKAYSNTIPGGGSDIYGVYPESGVEYFNGLSQKADRLARFFEVNDRALRWWRINNSAKPPLNSGVVFNGTAVTVVFMNLETNEIIDQEQYNLTTPLDRYKFFSHYAKSGAWPVGAVAENIPLFYTNFDLAAELGFQSVQYDHSRQFLSNIVKEKGYWKKVIEECRLETVAEKN